MTNIEVFYIALCDFGAVPLDRFLESYARFTAGRSHKLIVALKGYCDPVEQGEIAARCHAAGAETLVVPNNGFDIGTYFYVAQRRDAETICLLNSNSEILADGWLAKLAFALEAQGGGAVSASGSWESLSSDQLRIGDRTISASIRRYIRALRAWREFPAYPNPHLRTNALLIARADWLACGEVQPESKEVAWRFESGRKGLSAWLRSHGHPLRIVDRDGRAYHSDDWHLSATFWQAEQEGLLIADNQTRRYQDAEPDGRRALHTLAWLNPAAGGTVT